MARPWAFIYKEWLAFLTELTWIELYRTAKERPNLSKKDDGISMGIL
jgi:hypothetical protein